VVTEELIESGPARAMTEQEQRMATMIYDAIQDYSQHDERGQQTAEYRVGISDLGFCSERTRRMLAHLDPEDSDVLAAFLGTAIGDHVEKAIYKRWPHAIIQPDITVTLEGQGATYVVPGHPDVVLPEGLLLDVKTTRGLEVVRRRGPSQQQQFQRHCYAKGAWRAGLFAPHLELREIQVGNVWLDRAGDDKSVHVQIEPYDDLMVDAATEWLDEVVYNWQHDQVARKEPPAEMCRAVCGFYETCRKHDTDVQGLLTDETVLVSVDMYEEGKALIREGRRLQDQAKGNFPEGLQGSTGKLMVRGVWINGGHVEYDRQGYTRWDIRKV
jgi:hypothetical protein